jgi:hypothetical protein
MKYEKAKNLKDKDFKRFFGVKKKHFKQCAKLSRLFQVKKLEAEALIYQPKIKYC